MSVGTIVPTGDSAEAVWGREDGAVGTSRGDNGHDGKVNKKL